MAVKIGIVGGSGLYNMGILEEVEDVSVETPFGPPSDTITLGKIDGVEVAFLPRHGKGHVFAPHMINYRANIFALKQCGVDYLVSTAAVGSLKKELKPCDFVIADQLIDRTAKRASTFFDEGIVVHIGFADPFCERLSDLAYAAVKKEGVAVHRGCYICMEGPQFSTLAESQLYRTWDVDVIGMTLATEAKLAREAEMCLCGILMVTDYDCWYAEQDKVSVSSVVENLQKNTIHLAQIIKRLVPQISYKRTCVCSHALDDALITSPEILKKRGNPRVNEVLLKRFLK